MEELFFQIGMNPVVMDYIKFLTFQFYPLEPYKNEWGEWGRCIDAIDPSCRGLNKQTTKE